jgi:(p)ppGpp synthase/HD superfamily hydrolase
MTLKVRLARMIAKSVHDEEFYNNHIERVISILNQAIKDNSELNHEVLLIAGYCHDMLEDTKITFEDLDETFGNEVANLVFEVTHEKNDNGEWVFPYLKTREGYILKFADRLCNLSSTFFNNDKINSYMKKSIFWKSE